MRKTSKLLAVVLTLCLLFGAMTVIFASATEENPLDVSGYNNNLVSADPVEFTAAGNWYAYDSYNSALDLKNFKYVTFDFDLGTNSALPEYVNLFALYSATADSVDGDALNDKSYGGIYFFPGSDKEEGNTNQYIGDSAKKNLVNGVLKEGEGVTNHFTMIIKPVKSGDTLSAIQQYLYLNGKNVGFAVRALKAEDRLADCNTFMFRGLNVKFLTDYEGSVVIQNMAVNYYADADFSTYAKVNADAPAIYTADNVVYSATYPVPGATGYVQIGDAKCYIPGAVSAFFADNLKDETVVTLNGISVEDVTIPEEVKSFTIKTQNDATFSLSDDSDAKYMAIETEDGVSYSKLRENVYEKGDYSYGKDNTDIPAMSGSAPTSTGNRNVSLSNGAVNKYLATDELKQFKYVTIDYDFAYTSETVCNLKFPVNVGSVSTITDTTYVTDDHDTFATFTIAARADGCYVGNVKISGEKDVYDHFTILVAIDNSGAKPKLTAYVFANGKLAYTSEAFECVNEYNALSRLGLQYPTKDDRLTTTAEFKNITLNYYKDSSDIDSVLAGAPIYSADDVVYNASFVTLNKDTYATVNNYPYYVVDAAFTNLEKDETVTVYNVGTNYQLPASFALESFTIAVGAGEFSLAADDAAKYETTPVAGNGYKYTKLRATELDYTANDSYLYTESFEGKTGSVGTLANKAVSGIACENATKAAGVTATYVTDKNGNTYARVHTNSKATKSNRIGQFALRADTNLRDGFRDFSYVTFDYDFCVDQYAYAYGAQTLADGTTAPCYKTAASDAEFEAYINSLDLTDDVKAQYKAQGIASKSLAMPTDFTFSPFLHTANSAGVWADGSSGDYRYNFAAILYIRQIDGIWYACSSSESNDGAIQLSNELGVFDHFTLVFTVTDKTDNSYKVAPSIYVNGEFLKSLKATTITTGARFSSLIASMYTDKTRDHADKYDDKYSLAFDNLALNYYTAADLANTTLDETLAAGAPLYTATNVVYNEGYVTPNRDRYATLDDDFKYYVLGAAFSKLENCGTIYLHNAGKYTLPASLALNEFTLIASEGEYVYSADDEVRYTITEDGTVYTFSLNRSYVLLNDVEYTLAEALALLKSGDTLKLVRTDLENYELTLANLTVICDEYSTFTLSNKTELWRYAKIGNTYTRAIDGDVLANVDFDNMTNMTFNIYIPYTEALSYGDFCSDTDVSKVDKNIHDGGIVTIAGKQYLRIYWSGRMDYLTNEKPGYVQFSYTEGETTVELESYYTTKFSYIKYATYVAEYYPCGSEESQLVRAMTDYRAELYPVLKKYSSESISAMTQSLLDKFYAVYEKHENCTCATVVREDAKLDEKYITVGTAHGHQNAGMVSYAVSGRGIYMGVAAEASQMVVITYTDIHGTRQEVEKIAGENKIVLFAIAVTDLDNDFNIAVYSTTPTTTTNEDGEEVTTYVRDQLVVEGFDYSIADYVASEEFSGWVAAAKNFAVAAENYKKYIPAN